MDPSAAYDIPLDKETRQVRILLLHRGRFDDPIRGSLSVEPVQARFEALSYVWGDMEDTLPIEIMDREVKVTKNLETALRYLRNYDKTRRLWVDAVCINQSNNLERIHQVGMMDVIYSRAECVIAWLGLELSQLPAIELLRHFGSDPDLHWDPAKRASSGNNFEPPAFELFKWLQNPWYQRIWTLQEAVLAKSLIYMTGPILFQDKEFEGIIQSLAHHGNCCNSISILVSSRHADSGVPYAAFQRVLNLLFELQNQNGRLGFVEIASRFRNCEATDPRDKVFGILGLVDDILRDIIDYKKSTTDICSLATLECIRRTGNLDILSHVLPKQQSVSEDKAGQIKYDLPSWVPDWNEPRASEAWRLEGLSERQVLTKLFSACHSNSQAYPECPSQGSLRLHGLFCDQVAGYGIVMKLTSNNLEGSEVCQSWRELLKIDQEPEQPYVSGSTIFDAYWRTLCMDFCYFPKNRLEQPKRAAKNLRLLHDRWWWDVLSNTKYRHMATGREMGANYKRRLRVFPLLISNRLSDRKLFISRKGYIGLAPEDALEGDEIWILNGGRVPLILRPIGSQSEKVSGANYTLVGDSYVHGIMDGEFVEASMKRGRTPRPVVLV
ncbi:HET-domain-containing protein [Daldinia caldariorum]|uniref:HET-domain-containing protein n=1 Tax=Daldinia caldariorum TaxID=326644 RepID=UPI0020078602|nr:HET-domain-containing protein [Daldinia caldariorum]KAI1472364.1 HET-domain-containing protein [Daldinia caldariorum]